MKKIKLMRSRRFHPSTSITQRFKQKSIEDSLKTQEHGEQAMEPFGVDTKDLRKVKMIQVETMIAVGQLLTRTQVPVTPVVSQAK